MNNETNINFAENSNTSAHNHTDHNNNKNNNNLTDNNSKNIKKKQFIYI